MRTIVNVKAKDNYTLEIELSNKHKIICDMSTRLEGVRFCGLIDLEFFKEVHVKNPYTIEWDSMCEITIDEILTMIEK